MQDMIPQPLGKTTFSNQHFLKRENGERLVWPLVNRTYLEKQSFGWGKSVDTLLYCMGFCCE
jgi:hypothetical protein